MSIITEKRTYKIPPCKVNKNLIKDIGNILQKESQRIYKQAIENAKKDKLMSIKTIKEAREFIDKYFAKDYLPSFVLHAKSRDIESWKIDYFVDIDWPKDTDSILLSLGGGSFSRETEIRVELYLDSAKANQSLVSVSGGDPTWVHGITTQIEQVFKSKQLGYGLFMEHSMLRSVTYVGMLLAGFAVAHYVSPVAYEENVSWILFYFGLGMIFLEYVFRLLYPRFEFREAPLQKRIRRWIVALVVGSGILSAIVLKLVGLS